MAAKEAGVPRMTLGNRLKNYKNPMEEPKVGRPQELLPEEEEAIVKCLTLCGVSIPDDKEGLDEFSAGLCCGERC